MKSIFKILHGEKIVLREHRLQATSSSSMPVIRVLLIKMLF